MKVTDILASIDQGTMALPEFQRGYVWSGDQVRGFMQSLYRSYPVGSLLVWQTAVDATKLKGSQPTFGPTVQLLLDGQQRMSSLYGVMRDRPPDFFQGNAKAFSDLHFNVQSEAFEFYGPVKMKGDPTWIRVSDLFIGGFGPCFGRLSTAGIDAELLNLYAERINRVLAVRDRDIFVEQIVGPDHSLDEVVEIFNRVNSGGTKLSKGDLTLARICAEWPEARAQMLHHLGRWADVGYSFKLDWLLRVTNAIVTGQSDFAALRDVSPATLGEGLGAARGAIDSLLNLVASRLGLDHDRVLGGRYAFPVMARYVASHNGPLSSDEQQQLLFWYIHAFLWGRHSGSTETVLQQDLESLSKGGLDLLIHSLELWRGDLRVRPEHFAGSERGSRFYPMLYLLTRVGQARDLLTGIELKQSLLGKLSSLELHHIFPKALLRKHGYERGARNALANFCFLTKDSNLAVGMRDPGSYLAEVRENQPDALESQWIPEDPDLWRVENYGKFLERRRVLLAQAANDLLDSLRGGLSKEMAAEPGAAPLVVEDEDPELQAIVLFIRSAGLAEPLLHYEIVDDLTNEVVAQADAAWPDGLQERLTDPVAFLVEPDEEMEGRLGAVGYRFFTDRNDLVGYVEELLGQDFDGDGVIGHLDDGLDGTHVEVDQGSATESGAEPAEVLRFIGAASPPAEAQYRVAFARRCLDEMNVEPRQPESGKRRKYVNFYRRVAKGHRVAALAPGSGRLGVFVDPGAAAGFANAEVVLHKGKPAYVRVYLRSDSAVDDAIALTRLAGQSYDAPPAASAGKAPNAKELAAAFDRAVGAAVRECRQLGYSPNYFVQMLGDLGSVETARRLIVAPAPSDGFTTLWERSRLDLSVEAIALRPTFAGLFSDAELSAARQRLEEYGYSVA